MTAAVPASASDEVGEPSQASPGPRHLVLVESPPATGAVRRIQALIALLVLPASVVLTVIAIRLPADADAAARPAVELVGAPVSVADRLSASGFTVRPAGGAEAGARNSDGSAVSIVYYRDSDLATARRVHQALGRGTMVYRPMLHQGHDVTVVVGKDPGPIDDDRPPDP